MLNINTQLEKPRVNGYRIPGRCYLVGEKVNFQCCQLPFQINRNILPTAGIFPVAKELFKPVTIQEGGYCLKSFCPCAGLQKVAGYMWVGENEYTHAAIWFTEARTEEVQIECSAVRAPWLLKGKYILLAHRKAIVDYSDGPLAWVDSETGKAHTTVKYFPGVFAMFLVKEAEYIVKCQEPDIKLKKYYQRRQDEGFKLVRIVEDHRLAKEGLFKTDRIK